MQKRNCKSLEVQAEMNAEAELHIFGSPGRTSAEAELQIFASQGRAEVQKQNYKCLEVNAEQKCERGTSALWQ